MPGTVVQPASETSAATSAITTDYGAGEGTSPHPTAGHRQKSNPTEASTEEQLAVCFADTFEPSAGADYGWACDYAKDRFDSMLTVLKDLEDKASSAITFLGSGAGLLTMGAAVAVANPSIDRAVAAWSIPSIVSALLALGCAIMGRRTVGVPYPPPIAGAIELADYAKTEAKGKVLFAAQIHLCVTMMKPVLVRKAFWVEWCLRLAVVSVSLMLAPLIAALSVSKPGPDEPKPTRVIIEQATVQPAAP